MSKGKILIVDDDAFSRTLCADILGNGDFTVKAVNSGAEAMKIIDREDYDIVITDLVMPGMNGLEVLDLTKQYNTLIDVVVVTGHSSIETAITALKKGAFDYIRKPINEDELLLTVNNCMEKKKLLEENLEMRQSLKLFEVSRAVASTLDINRLYTISLDSLIQMVPGEAGILLFYENGGDELGLKAVRHLDTKIGEKMAQVFKKRYEKDLRNLESITVISCNDTGEEDRETFKGFKSILVAPLIRGKDPLGFLLVLSDVSKSDYTIRDVKNASFISEHASTAFENAQKYVEAKEMAYIDSLTNLYNAKYLDMVLDKELKRADRLAMPVTVLFIDLDNFKRINDDNDHLIGSKVLVEVGKILLKSVREVDTVIRYGGDEYVVILLDADSETGFIVADRIRAAIEDYDFIKDEGLGIKITASIGLATYPMHTKQKKELLKMADMAMYKAKDISRNLVYLTPVPGSEAAKGGGGGG